MIEPNWLYSIPFEASFNEIIEKRIELENYPLSTNWIDYILTKFIEDKDSLDTPFFVESYETSLNSLLIRYTIGYPNSRNLDETPLIVLFTAIRAITAKRLIKENIKSIQENREPVHDIEVYF